MTKSKEAETAPSLVQMVNAPKARSNLPDSKGQGRATCKLLHLPAVILTQILQGQGQSHKKGLISKTNLGFRLSIWRNKCWYLGGEVESGLA